ncbi:phytanoyl-CoA dioxygenase family protein [Azospirillum thermophilum]|uniref:Phytanoyl-CoA dioxygenase n=1 Tax=Azospirillum thermophilum TaxID=2202148 RepID=A0A2S2D0F1_9PROT|nr:phytanoyl-CoA dioxygenase family protein [Azospirillum thermophilum]AWK90243.1 hypothetical protein DEW08_29980 [Azospirillum thermophilum]
MTDIAWGIDTDLSAYERDGFLILRNVLPRDLVSRVVGELTALCALTGVDEGDLGLSCSRLDRENQEALYRLYLAAPRLPAFAALSAHLAGVAARISGADLPVLSIDTIALFSPPRDSRLAYNWHQENSYMPGLPGDVMTFWCPLLDPATVDNGAMSVLAASHRLGRLPYRKISRPRGYTDLLPHDAEAIAASHREHVCIADPGDAVVFQGNMLHRSNHNATNRTRVTGIFRYIAACDLPANLKFSADMY